MKKVRYQCRAAAFHKHERHDIRSHFLPIALVTIVLLALASITHAEPPLKIRQLDHVSWTRKDGVPSGVSELAAGADGMLWIASAGGLYQFDGMHFTLFTSGSASPAFPSGEVETVYVSTDGTVWAGQATGIVSIKDGHVRLYDSGNGLLEGQVKQILQSADGMMWAIVRNKLFHLVGEQWFAEAKTTKWPSEDVWRLCFDKDGTQWMAAGTSIYRRALGEHDFSSTGLKTEMVTSIVQIPDGTIWVTNATPDTTPGSIWRIGRSPKGYVKQARIAAEGGWIALVASPSSFWATFNGGIVAVSNRSLASSSKKSDSASSVLLDRYAQVDGLSGKIGIAGARDKTGNFWVATDKGLDRFKIPVLTRFFASRGTQMPVVASNNRGPVWIAGVNWALTSVTREGFRAHGPVRDYHAIYCDREDNVWLDGASGLMRYGNEGFRHFAYPKEFLFRRYAIHEMVELDAHHFIVSVLRNGLWMFNDEGAWSKVSYPGIPDNKMPVSLYYDDKQAVLWLGYIDGAIIRLKSQHVDVLPAPKVPHGSVLVFAESRLGLLVGTASGLSLIQNDVLLDLPTNDGMELRGVSGIVEARNGDLWINGVGGVFRVASLDLTAASRDPRHRLYPQSILLDNKPLDAASQMIGLPTAMSGSDGKIWFTNFTDLVSVDPAAIPSDGSEPLISVRSIASEAGFPKSLINPVFPRAHTLRIGYFGMNLTDPDGVVYRYELDRIDKTWLDVGSRTEAVYTDLPPGTYTFHVAGSNRGDKWSDYPAQLTFTILPGVYETVWFRTICLLVVAGLLWVLFTLRLRYVAAHVRERSEERANERVRIARDLHDTLLQGVQALMWRFQIAVQELPEGSQARGALDSALGSADTVLSEARERVKGLRETPTGAGDLASVLAQVGNELNWTGSVAFRVETRGNAYPLAPAAQEELFSVAREALTNSFRHSQASEITVEITYGRSSVALSCRDNGCGMSPDVVKEGVAGHWGLLGMRERASKLGATLECWSTVGSGTEVFLRVSLRGAKLRRMLLNWT